MKRKVLILLFWVFVWYLLAVFVNNSILLATPLQAAVRLAELFVTADFWRTIVVSLLRIAGGFFPGVCLGILLAAASAKSRLVEELLSPVMRLFKTVPVASMAVLLLIWWGSSMLAVSVCFLVVLPGIYLQTLEGIKGTDAELLQMASVFQMPLRNRFFYIYRPALKPFLTGSMKLALGMSWKSAVAAEVIGTPLFSIGERLYMSKIYLDTAGVFAWTAVIILFSLCFEKLVLRLTELFFQWEPHCGKPRLSEKKGRRGSMVCRGVSKSYGKISVLKDFEAEYLPGGTYYLRERSGSGKTTLLKLLCGLERPDAGEVEAEGRCSMMFQEDRLCMDYSAVRNVEMVTGDAKKAEEALSLLLERDALYRPCRQLSGGMKRRVALVRAMEFDSDIVLLDEPFTGMDADTRRQTLKYIEKRRCGRTMVIATHAKALNFP